MTLSFTVTHFLAVAAFEKSIIVVETGSAANPTEPTRRTVSASAPIVYLPFVFIVLLPFNRYAVPDASPGTA